MIADTGPINYLLLTGHIEILPALFDRIIVPAAVRDELTDQGAPGAVRDWMAATPAWLEVRDIAAPLSSPEVAALGAGERSAIELAIEIGADLVLMDDRKGVAAAVRHALMVTGTMGLLVRAARRGLVEPADAFERLKKTNFRCRAETMDALLAEALKQDPTPGE